uniref:Uncharacterized protein n=1 Tax=Mus musculus TaxID=10090 RepID=Q8C8F5_MOUSE|nr:unnamed protein product [Mus musculus]
MERGDPHIRHCPPSLSAATATQVPIQYPVRNVASEAADLCPPKPWKPAQRYRWPLCSVCPPLYLTYVWMHHVLVCGRAPYLYSRCHVCVASLGLSFPLCQLEDRLA